jgi:serine/threonine protein kinase
MNLLVRSLFTELADLSLEDRERVFVTRRISPDVRAEVESLLVFDSTRCDLTQSVSLAAEHMLQSNSSSESMNWGPYRRIRLLGSGGMGSVYLAERTDGEIEQKVAVKLLRSDVDRPAWRDRFLKERQFLASLSHPSIARLIDAGHTSDGHPYLVMEYVEGVPIDVYAEKVDLQEKLALFLRVCEGVSHAHSHLIIHRDLKPSNILVDASGQPKLLDFGIAKLLDQDAAELTQTVDRLLTPNYASPEHVRGAAETTASDVYSLGAVLYKVLTGRSPREIALATGQTTGDATQAPAPSTKRLNPNLPADIHYILRKALRSEPAERYVSVEAFANDIRAFLEWRPVHARSGDAWYRTRKFMRRYWVRVSAAAVAIVSLTVGIGVANYSRAVAERRFNEVRQLSNKLFDIDAQVRQLPGSSQSRQLIVETSLNYLRRLAGDAVRDPDLAMDLGTAYMRVGRVQGVPISPNLGQMENAEQNLRMAEDLIQSVLRAQPGNRKASLRAAQIAHDRMVLAQSRRPDTQALPLAHESAKWLNNYLNTGQVDDDEKDQVVIVGMNVANWYLRKEETDAGFALLRRTIDIARATGQQRQAAAAQVVMARALRTAGDLEAALSAIREGVSLMENQPGEKSVGQLTTLGLALVTQGEVLGEDEAINLGRSEEAAEFFERGYKMAVDMARRDPNDSQSRLAIGNRGVKLAGVLRHTEKERALAVYDEVLRYLGQVKNNSGARLSEVRALAGSTHALRQLGRLAEARQRLEAALSRLKDLKLYPAEEIQLGSELAEVLRAHAEIEVDAGNVARGNEIYEDLHRRIMTSQPDPEHNLETATNLSNIYKALASLRRRTNQNEAASALDAQRLELWRHWEGKLKGNDFVRRQLEGIDRH